MLFSTSPVKNISEKIKPLSESGKGKVSRLKFDRKSDYKTFLDFIKKNTKDLEEQQIKKEKKTSAGAFGILGLGLLGGAFGGGKDDDNKIKTSFIPKALQRAKLEAESQRKKAIQSTSAATGITLPLKKFKFEQGRKPAPYRRTNLGKEYIFNRERRNKIVKSKQTVKESTVSQERVYNQNRKKKTFSKTKVAAEVGGRGFGGASGNRRMINVNKTFFPGDQMAAKKPQSSLGKGEIPDDIKKAIKLTQEFQEGKRTRQSYENEMNKLKNYTPPDKTPKTLDQIAKDLGKGKKTLRFNFQRGYQAQIPGLGDVSGDVDLPFEADTFRYDKSKSKNKINAFKQPSLLDELIFGGDKNKPLKMFDKKISIKDRFMFNPNTNRAGGSGFTSMGNFFGDKSFTAPDVPKGQPKLSGFDKFNRFTNRIFNSPAYKFGSFIGGMMANYKLEIIKQLLTPTPLADGTLEGKPGVNNFNSEKLLLDEDTSVNIFNFSEGRESMIPLSANIKAPIVSKPSDLKSPSNDVFIDIDFNTSEDLFFMKMGGS